MAYSPLTTEGKHFITEVCKGNGNSLLQGSKGVLPYTNPAVNKTWVCDIKDPNNSGKTITTNSQLGQALIFWFEKYANDFQLDANVIAAQAFAESSYIAWNYAGGGSTASGINQFTMTTIFWVIVENMGLPKTTHSDVMMDTKEIVEIIYELKNPYGKNSYAVGSTLPADAVFNRPILHQNVINNPGIMIKAQCYYMKTIANKSDSLTSTSLFCYSRGMYMSTTYSRAIQKCDKDHTGKLEYKDEGLKYVLKIFGILGDKNNYLSKTLDNYKPKNLYFGYDESKGVNDPRNLRLMEKWTPYDANVDESTQYNVQDNFVKDKDVVIEELSNYKKYKFIYYPENNYKREDTKKRQIVLHHTVSGEGAGGDVLWWEHEVARSGTEVATSFIVTRDGTILQLFSTKYWAWHLGIDDALFKIYGTSGIDNTILNSQSVGIEIDSWGGLINSGGNWYPAGSPKSAMIPIKNVVEYKAPDYANGYHGYAAFEKYTDEQIASLRVLINAITFNQDNKISLDYMGDDMWGKYDSSTNKWLADSRAYGANNSGIWTHTSFRPDKSDCHPQTELKNLLKTLK